MAIAEILTVILVIGVKHVACSEFADPLDDCSSAHGFRVFYDPDLRDLGDRLPPDSPERLAFAARKGDSYVVRLTRSAQLGIAQEGAGISIDCLPWLSRFPGGSIRWKYIQLDEFGNPLDNFGPQEISPNQLSHISSGGESSRWLNISQIVVVGGGDPDSKIFICEVCQNHSNPDEECHVTNYTSWLVGAPPIAINGSSTVHIDALRSTDQFLQFLDCGVDDHNLPEPNPLPTRSWFKDGQLISSAQYLSHADIEWTYLMENSILMTGVFNIPTLQVLSNGTITMYTGFTNITSPELLEPETTLEQARELLFDIFLGNWTCHVNNSLGSFSIEYILREGFNDSNAIPAENETRTEVGWLKDSIETQELSSGSLVLQIGVREGAENLQENITFSVESFPTSNDSTVFTLLTTAVDLSPPSWAGDVLIELHKDGIANSGNTTVQFKLVPMATLNESGVILRDILTLTIIDTDRVNLSFSQSEYTVSESNSTFLIQLNKNKPLANPLEVGVATLTLEEADLLGYLPLNNSLKQAEVDEDFRGTSYFSSRATFAADDEGEVPTNQLNISIPLIIDDVIAEDQETFVIVIELRPLCESGALVDVQQWSALIHVTDNDGCGSDSTILPLDKTLSWLPTLRGDSLDVRCPVSSPDLAVTRTCGSEEREWMEPLRIQDCYNATIDEAFTEISKMLNQTSLEVDAASLLAETLGRVTPFTVEFGAGQSSRNLEVTARVFETLAPSDVNDQVVLEIVNVLDDLSNWQRDVLQERSSYIVNSFETITANLTKQANFTNLTSTTEDIILHAQKGEVERLLKNGKSVNFNTMQGVSFSATAGNISAHDISSVFLPPSLFEHLRNQTSLSDQPGLVFTSYSTAVLFPLTQPESTNSTRLSMIGSSVLAATVVSGQPNAVRNLAKPVVVEFRVNRSMLQNALSVQCVSWNFEAAGGRGNWTGEGCQAVLSENDDKVRCHCSHLTNFAILVEICVRTGGCEEPDPVYLRFLQLSSIIGVSLSIGGLLFAILTQLILIIVKSRSSKERERQSAIQYKFYLQLCLALLGMYIVFLAGINRTQHFIGCVVASVLLHYLTLAAVLWMSAICSFLFWIMVVNPFAQANFKCCRMAVITLICWGVPMIPAVIPVAIDRDFVVAYSHEMPRKIEFCFIKDPIVFFAAFIGPLFLLVVTNAVMFVCITFVQLRHVCCRRRQQAKDSNNGSKSSNMGENCVIVLKLWCILCLFGLTWLFGALTITTIASFIFSTLFAVFTSLQGFFVFVFLCILSKDALRTYKCICCRSREVSTTSDSQGRKTNSNSTKSSSLVTKDLYESYKPTTPDYKPAAHDNAMKLAFTQELSTKIKRYDLEHDTAARREVDELKTSTFKPIIIR